MSDDKYDAEDALEKWIEVATKRKIEIKRLKDLLYDAEDKYDKLWQMYGDLEAERDQLEEALENLTTASERECRSDSVLRKFLLPHCKAAREVLREVGNEKN